MSGYLGGDHCSINAQAIVDDHIALVISQIPIGEGTRFCIDCGEEIPKARRVVLPGCTTCIQCQVHKDNNRPRIRAVTKML